MAPLSLCFGRGCGAKEFVKNKMATKSQCVRSSSQVIKECIDINLLYCSIYRIVFEQNKQKRPSLALKHRNASLVFDDGGKIQKRNETFKFEEIWRKENYMEKGKR